MVYYNIIRYIYTLNNPGFFIARLDLLKMLGKRKMPPKSWFNGDESHGTNQTITLNFKQTQEHGNLPQSNPKNVWTTCWII